MDPTFQDVLVVDDDPAMGKNLSHILEPAGFRVRTATDGAEALKLVRQQCPYFVITDWVMSPVDGIELCHLLRQENLPHYVYVVLLTAKSQADDIITGLNAGADDFVTKPVSKGELLARLQAGSRVLELESRLGQLARCDALTGVLNSRTFYQLLEMEWTRAIRHDHHLSCVMIDVDFFKQTNDTHGHLVGDAVLKSLAEVVKAKCRTSDCLCRWGGDEFCVLLPETDEQGACIWAERCCSTLAENKLCTGLNKLPITASFGVAQSYRSMQSPEQLLHLADQALLAAKRAGRQRVVTAWGGCLSTSDGMTLAASERAANEVVVVR
jgi:two-component system, cell cycle response regulator